MKIPQLRLRSAIATLLPVSLAIAALGMTDVRPSAAPAGLHASGDRVVDAAGKVVRLHGADFSGPEYDCVQGYGVFDGATPDQAVVDNLLAAHVNSVRIPMNEDCWLAINGVASAYAGPNYQNPISAFVDLLISNGITPILDLHWSAPGTKLATGQQAMPDQDHSPAFWQGVASAFKDRTQVIFDLYNEPFPSSWACWRDATSCGIGYAAAGMQSLVNVVRAAGATNLVMLGCLDYSNTCSGHGGSWWQYKPADPDANLAASVHIYKGNPCVTTSCWTSQWLPILQHGSPIVNGEWGAYIYTGANYDPGFGRSVLDWFDRNHVSGYDAWTWNNWGVWSRNHAEPLIQTDNGSRLSTWGLFVKAQYQSRG